MSKLCSLCKLEKDGKDKTRCKTCMAKKSRDYRIKYRETVLARRRQYRIDNHDKVLQKDRAQYHKHREKNIAAVRDYQRRNKEKINAYDRVYRKRRRQTDINFKLKNTIRIATLSYLKRGIKSARTLELLGCTIEELKLHLQSKFTEGMTWDNHGQFGWHIDHIIPCASFDLTDPEQQRKCFHYTNLQPLWWRDNIIKSDKILEH